MIKESRIKLIGGLGNPGTQYRYNHHNVGFMAAEKLREKYNVLACVSRFEALICETHLETGKIFILTPKTFMNESGKPIGEFARFYKIEPQETLIIHDDLDLPLGHLRLSESGSAGGHNGVQSAIDNFGAEFWRLRIGIGDNRAVGMKSEDYVLQNFKPEEKEIITKSLEKSVEIISKLLAGETPDQINNQIAEYNKSISP